MSIIHTLKNLSIIKKYDPLTLSRIEEIEEVPLALDSAMEGVQRSQNRDLPKEQRPGDCTKYYRYSGGRFIISSFKKQKVINCIVDGKCCYEGKIVNLFPIPNEKNHTPRNVSSDKAS